jgi:chromosome segregation ATPase
MSDQIEILDSRISEATKAANAKASKAKSTRAKLWDLLVGGSEKARELHDELTALQAEQAFEETRIAALAGHRAKLAADKAAKEAAAEKRAKVDAFRLLVKRRDEAATAAEKAANQLGQAVRDLTALTTEIKLALPTVDLPRNAIDPEAVRYGIEGSLFFAGMSWLFPEKPMPKYDAQGNLVSNIEERIKRSGAGLLAMLPED